MNVPDHLPDDVLIRALDDEVSVSEAGRIESHLQACEECRHRYRNFRSLSEEIEVIAGQNISPLPAEREALLAALDAAVTVPTHHAHSLRPLGWVLALAASLALAILSLPRWLQSPVTHVSAPTTAAQSAMLEVDGESFIPLPYSNPDLPITAPHIVEMQVPVLSLASAGIVLEPVSGASGNTERTVLADVLVGMDGQPMGVHVLSFE